MTNDEFEQIISNLIGIFKAQTEQARKEIRELKHRLKNCEDGDRPNRAETKRQRNKRIRKEMEEDREGVLRHWKRSLGEPGCTPDVEEFITDNIITNLMEVNEHIFRLLIRRDFNAELEEAYKSRTLRRRIFMRIVRFFDNAEDVGELKLDDDMKDAAEKLREEEEAAARQSGTEKTAGNGVFHLQGRTELETFFNEHVVDIANNRELYARFGVNFPKPFILEGPPGCGKTYAVERLAEHLGWHTERITAGNVGSTYVHGTAKKIEESFEEAAKHAPAILIVDEMDAFMPNRATSGDHHTHVKEEVGSFLKCIQEAEKNQVLVIGMTNLIDTIDPAIMRTGRMGTHLKVGMPSLQEVEAVMRYALEKMPHAEFPLTPYAEKLLEHPLSDVTHAVDTAGMRAARERRDTLEEADLAAAIDRLLELQGAKEKSRPFGFAA